jgi:hypothetical protein
MSVEERWHTWRKSCTYEDHCLPIREGIVFQSLSRNDKTLLIDVARLVVDLEDNIGKKNRERERLSVIDIVTQVRCAIGELTKTKLDALMMRRTVSLRDVENIVEILTLLVTTCKTSISAFMDGQTHFIDFVGCIDDVVTFANSSLASSSSKKRILHVDRMTWKLKIVDMNKVDIFTSPSEVV